MPGEANNDIRQGKLMPEGQLSKLQRVQYVAQQIAAALDTDDLEKAALRLAWTELLERLLNGDPEQFSESVAQIQKLSASTRTRRKRSDARQGELFGSAPDAGKITEIERILGLL